MPPALISRLVPEWMVVCEVAEGREADLLPQEAAMVAHAARKRRIDFAAGRRCARYALKHFGHAEFPLLADTTRAPRWPDGIVGSITHTKGYAAAAVAELKNALAIGIDAEEVAALTSRVLPLVLTPSERARIWRLAPAARPLHAAIAFSAKEAFFKLQFPLTGARPGFHDIEVLVTDDQLRIDGVETLEAVVARLEGRWNAVTGYVATALWISAG